MKGLRETASTTLGDWQYFYNDRGELTGGVKTKNGVVVPGYQFGYVFDAIGNRTTAEVTTNGHTATSTLTPNALNQITARTVPGELQVRGHVSGNATTAQVGLKNGTTTDWHSALPIVSGNFAAAVPVNNSAGIAAARLDIRATTSNPEKEVKSLHRAVLPPQNETLTYDDDGNIASDGLWTYTWDVENRLIKMQAKPGAAPWSAEGNLPASAASLEFAYDWMGRRIHSRVKDLAGHIIRVTDFVWDGWNIVAEVDATPRVFLYYQGQQYYFPQGWATSYRTYVWGADVSGSPAGAGGVGGLLAVHLQYMDAAPVPVDPMYGGQYLQGDDPWSVSVLRTDYPVYDGNGNIMSYLNAATGAVEQEEEYGPFGENLRPRSTNILRCPIGWSTKYTDEETGHVYYGRRYYIPSLGCWASKDPIAERGGLNLFGFVANSPCISIDPIGLSVFILDQTYDSIERADGETKPMNQRVKKHSENKQRALDEFNNKTKDACKFYIQKEENGAEKTVEVTREQMQGLIEREEINYVPFRKGKGEEGDPKDVFVPAADSPAFSKEQIFGKLHEFKGKCKYKYDKIGFALHGSGTNGAGQGIRTSVVAAGVHYTWEGDFLPTLDAMGDVLVKTCCSVDNQGRFDGNKWKLEPCKHELDKDKCVFTFFPARLSTEKAGR